MPKTFDDYIPEKIPKNKPKGHPASGAPEEVLKSVMYDHVKNEKNKPHTNVEFSGLVIMSQKISTVDMFAKYDSAFLMYLGKLFNVIGDKDSTGWGRTEAIIESRVYIPEISACLPQPADVEKLFKTISDFTKKDYENPEKMLKEQQKKISLTKAEIRQIERYPLAYYVASAQKSGGKTKTPSSQSLVTVQFPYSFDFSYGVITGVAP